MLMELNQTPKSVLNPSGLREYKLVVIGPRGVGKSALVVRFLTKRFINEYLENTDMTCLGAAEVDGEHVRVNIQDTSEKGMRMASLDHYCRWADAIMLVYSVTDDKGFVQVKELASKITAKFSDENRSSKDQTSIPPLVLVGNKCDLDYVRKVSQKDGHALASECLRCDFYESSAREGWSMLVSLSPTSAHDPVYDSDAIKRWASSVSIAPPLKIISPTPLPVINVVTAASSSSPCASSSSASSTPTSDCDSDDSRGVTSSNSRLAVHPKQRRKGSWGHVIGKLSPVLGRKIAARDEHNSRKTLAKSRNAMGGSLGMFASHGAGGSSENVDGAAALPATSLTLPRRRHSNPDHDKIQALSFDGSEPFVHLCRQARQKTRFRSRSPSHFIRSSFRRIYNLATDNQNNHHHGNHERHSSKSPPVICVNSSAPCDLLSA